MNEKKMIIGLSVVALFLVVMTAAVLLYSPVSGDGVIMRFVSGTEYTPGQAGKIIVELRDSFYNPITTATCSAIFTLPTDVGNVAILPSSFSAPLSLGYLSTPQTYSGNFTAPTTPGVYTYTARCINGSDLHGMFLPDNKS